MLINLSLKGDLAKNPNLHIKLTVRTAIKAKKHVDCSLEQCFCFQSRIKLTRVKQFACMLALLALLLHSLLLSGTSRDSTISRYLI